MRNLPEPGQAISLTIPASGLSYPNRFKIPGTDDDTVYTLTATPRRTVIRKVGGSTYEIVALPVSYVMDDPDFAEPIDVDHHELYLRLDVQVEVIW